MLRNAPPSASSILPCHKNLSADEVDRHLVALSTEHQRVETDLCFYLREMDERALYRRFSFRSTIDYARERLGFDDRKTWFLLNMARKFDTLPKLGEAFAKGELPWTKVREAVKVATPETEDEWLGRCREMSNRQLEAEVRRSLPPVRKKRLVFVLEGERVDAWEAAREALEQLAGKTLTDLEVLDLMQAEVLATHAGTRPFRKDEEEDDADGGFVRLVAERDGWRCARPGCTCRSALEGHHIQSRAKGGSKDPSNVITVCVSCHAAVTSGRIKVSGRAPDELLWEGPWGVIEKPVALGRRNESQERGYDAEPRSVADCSRVREAEETYGFNPALPASSEHVFIQDKKAARTLGFHQEERDSTHRSARREWVRRPVSSTAPIVVAGADSTNQRAAKNRSLTRVTPWRDERASRLHVPGCAPVAVSIPSSSGRRLATRARP